MSDYSITPQLIYDHTTGGLDVFDFICPGAAKAYENNKHFKLRSSESTASAHLKEYDGVFWIKDFGNSKKAMNCIEFVMDEEGLDFFEALKWIVTELNVPVEQKKGAFTTSEYRKEEIEEGEQKGDISFKTTEWDKRSLQAVFAPKVWERLKGLNRKREEDKSYEPKSDKVAQRNAIELCKKYGFVNLEWYSLVSAAKDEEGKEKQPLELFKNKFIATSHYPINMWEAGKWRKIYKPKEPNKKYRFIIQGKKTRVMFGLSECQKALEKLQDQSTQGEDELDEGSAPTKKEIVKLDSIIICSGGSDAINVAACGYNVVWFDNEMFKLKTSEWAKLSGMAHRVYYLGDIDESGIEASVELGKQYLDLELIFLPQYLAKQYDQRGNACKDVRDFFKKHGSKDFESVVNQSMPIRFWSAAVKKNNSGKAEIYKGQKKYIYKPIEELILNFLHHEGFARYDIPSDKRGYTIVKRDDNVIKRDIKWEDVYQHVKNFLRSPSVMGLVRGSYLDLVNAFNRSPAFSRPILENLHKREYDFESSGRHYQYMFFKNATWKVFADKIEVVKVSDTKVKVWEDQVMPQKAKISKKPPFEITFDDKSEKYDIKINDKDNVYLNFLIQTSRIHWRRELEEELDKLGPDEKAKYVKENKFNIAGPLLNDQERYEQKQVLISKLCAFGYLLHEFKDRSKAYAVWCTDHTSEQFTEETQSFGGTGKSIGFDTLANYLDLFILPGRDQKKMESEFVFHGVTKHTRVLYTDDAGEFFKFQLWYTLITGSFPVNPKFGAPYTLSFKEAPKLAFTSNFPTRKNDGSTKRRLWYITNSSYYHKNTNGEFREDREPWDDFKMELFGDEFSDAQWNKTHNVMACCLQSWLKFGKVRSVEETIYRNILMAKMTHNFKSWADECFHPDNNRLDTWVQRNTLYELYKRYNTYKCTPQTFLDRLKAWVEYNEFTFNPKVLLGDKKRMMKHVELETIDRDNQVIKIVDNDRSTAKAGEVLYKKGTQEVIFIQTKPLDGSQEEDSEDDMPF